MPVLSRASPGHIIRSNQKDETYQSYLRSSVADVIQSILGARTLLRWRKELEVIADLGYFGLTTLAGFQTLGEEYVNLVQVDRSQRAIPSQLRRLLLILLHVCTPYILDKLLTRFEKYLRSGGPHQLPESQRKLLLRAVPVIRQSVDILHRCHLVVFYLRGAFYHIAKRVSGVRYVLVRGGLEGQGSSFSYRFLGWLAMAQLIGTVCQSLYRAYTMNKLSTDNTSVQTRHEEESSGQDGTSSPGMKCALCLEARQNTTATPCGHLFCWNCILEWCATKAECPLCREKFKISRLIPLQNYDAR